MARGGVDVIDLDATMKALAARRPVFHSEADFQHALAMQVARTAPEAKIRLESRPVSHERVYLDLWIEHEGRKHAIELKYKTRSVSVDWDGEHFDLANQGAQDLGAYDVWKDVQRVEAFCSHFEDIDGYVIFLSNDPVYWSQPASDSTVGAAFRLNEGRIASGGLYWASHAGEGTMKNREKPILLKGTYRVTWNDYARLGTGLGLALRYAIIPIRHIAPSGSTVTEPAREESAPQKTFRAPASSGRRRSKYSPLRDYLSAHKSDRVELTYAQIEEIIGATLPPSSRNHAAVFWANHYGGTHVWATQWMDAGWKVDSHSASSERVVFIRTGQVRST
jgi:hypothetical protein